MKINYFTDTDTALLEFTDTPIQKTLELSENLYLDIDMEGNPVSLPIEHASQSANMQDISFHQVQKEKTFA